MSTHRNRAKLKKAEDERDYQRLLMNELYPIYWDEGANFYPRYRRGFKSPCRKQTQLQKYEQRMYRTWKHSRKKQWHYISLTDEKMLYLYNNTE